ncbi:MAG: protein-methionine-sulfoxide reductase heme-binding subunit MsrQ [Halocynthiibacter sp.]
MVNFINTWARKIPAWLIYIIGVLPFIGLVAALFAGQLGVDPVKELEHELGEIGLQVLIASLLITPLRNWFKINLIKFRRALSLVGFFYVAMHFAVWLVLDVQLYWSEIIADIVKRPYIMMGAFSLIVMIPLAVTSNNWAIRQMRANWRKLHLLAYLGVAFGAAHYIVLSKTVAVEPLLYCFVVALLLGTRLLRQMRSTVRV